jgi:hypothetical protein
VPHHALLLNVGNLKSNLTYPYAFVQLTEIADRFGIEVISRDLFGIPEDEFSEYLTSLLNINNFDAILITLRNTDTVGVEDYEQYSSTVDHHQPKSAGTISDAHYYPIHLTKSLIHKLRKLTQVPIVIGGFGFSILPEKMMGFLEPDFGVIGEPDGFFENFNQILSKKELNRIPNLIYTKDGVINYGPRVYYPPSFRSEYTQKIINQRQVFYNKFIASNDVTLIHSVPIEISRGCPKRCIYCAEPYVKGRKVQYRNLKVVEEEIDFLATFGLNNFFLICSEINADGNKYILQLAERLIKINQNRPENEKITWYGLYLMKFSGDEFELLRKSGFLGGWYDVASLEDVNLTDAKVPYLSEEIINNMKAVYTSIRDEASNRGIEIPSREERIFHGKTLDHANSLLRFDWSLFIGNTATTINTIQETLRKADEAGFYHIFDECFVNKATRVYDYLITTDKLLEFTTSYNTDGKKRSYNELLPSFTYPPGLQLHFKDTSELKTFLDLIQDVYLSANHLFKQKWNWFLSKYTNPSSLFSWWDRTVQSKILISSISTLDEVQNYLKFLIETPTIENIELLFNPTPGREKFFSFIANIVMKNIFYYYRDKLTKVLDFLNLASDLDVVFSSTPYQITVSLFQHYADEKELFQVLRDHEFNDELTMFFINYLLYQNSIQLKSKYQTFFINSSTG